MKTNTPCKCFYCGAEEILNLYELTIWICKKDKERLDKFMRKLKTKRTRYHSIESYINAHKLKDYQRTGTEDTTAK